MKRYVTDIADLFMSDDIAADYGVHDRERAGEIISQRLNQFFSGRAAFQAYCEEYANQKRVKPYCILQAHGSTLDGWIFKDGEDETGRVQDWIHSVDGKYGALLIGSCNPAKHDARSKKSLLWIAAGNVINAPDSNVRNFSFDLIHPKKGLIDSYCIEDELQQLTSRKPRRNQRASRKLSPETQKLLDAYRKAQ